MGDIYTWRDSPTGPPDEPTRYCGEECEHWYATPTDKLLGFADCDECKCYTPIGTECWL